MTSRRSWLLGLALGAAITVGSMQDAHAQVPRTFTYQGQLLNNGVPDNSGTPRQIQIRFYTDQAGTNLVHTHTESNVQVVNGIFNIEVGQTTPLPPTLDFTQQYYIGVSVDGGQELGRTRLHSVPYAINSNAVNGFTASATPQPNALLALDANSKIDPSVLPAVDQGIETINTFGPDANGNFTITAGTGITIQQDATGLTIASSGNTGGIQNILLGDGLIGGGTPNPQGEVMISLAPNAVTGDMIGNGVITGMKLSALIAGEGLSQDILGNLQVNAGGGLEVTGDQVIISVGGVGSAQIADGSIQAVDVNSSQIQLRVTGTAPAGSFITGINENGSVNSGTVNVNSTLTRAVNGSNLDLGINLANPNTWTGLQTFNGGAAANSLTVTGPTTLTGTVNQSGGDVTLGGNLNANGGLDVMGASTFAGTMTQTGGGQVSFSGNVDATNGLDVTGLTTTQGINNTGAINTGTLTSTGNVTVGDDLFVQNQITSPSAGHTLGTNSTNATVLTINGVADNGVVDEFVVNGDASFSGLVEFNDVTVDVLTANTVNTGNLGSNGVNPINVTSDINLGTNDVNNGIFNNFQLNSGVINVGQTLTNNGTITGGAITNAQISGGNINGTIIGNTTPAEGTFTDVTVNDLADIQRLQVNTTSHFDGLATFGTAPATDGNKVVIDGVVTTPTNTLTGNDYELVVNGDAQITGTLFVNNFQANILSAPIIRFDFAEPFTPGGEMTFRLGGVNFDGAGTVGDLITVDNVPGGAWAMTIHNQATTNGIKLTGDPGSGTAIDIDPYDVGINMQVDVTGMNINAGTTGINITNAPTSISADGLITTTANINADGIATIGAGDMVTIGTNAGTNEIMAADGTINTPSSFNVNGQFNVNAANGNTTTNGTVDAEGTVTAGAGNRIVIGTSNTNDIDVNDGTVHSPDGFDMEGALQVGNAGQFNVSTTGAVTTTSTIDAESTVTAGAGNMITIGTNAATNEISAADGTINTPSDWAFGGAVTIAGNLDVAGTGTFGGGASNFVVLGTSATNDIDAHDGIVHTPDAIDAEGTVTAGAGNNVVIGTGAANEIDAADGTVNTPDNFDAEGTGTFGAGNMLVLSQAGSNEVDAADGTVNTLDNFDAEGTGTFGAGNMLVLSQAGSNEVDAADGTVNTLDNIDAEGTVTSGAGNMIVIGTAVSNEVDAADGTINTLDNIDAEGTVTSGAGNMIVIGTAVTNEVDAADGTINTLDNIDAEGTGTFGAANRIVLGTATTNEIDAADNIINTLDAIDAEGTITAGAGNNVVIGTGAANEIDAADGTVNTPDNFDAEGTGTFGAGNMVVIGTNAATNEIQAADGTLNIPSAVNIANDLTNSGDATLATGAGSTTTLGTAAGGDVTINVQPAGASNIVIPNMVNDPVPTRWMTLNGADQVRVTDISGTADEGVSWDAVAGQYELGDETNTGVAFTEDRFVNLNANDLTFTRNNGTETALFMDGGTMGVVNVQPTNGNLNLGNDNGVNTINGSTIADGLGMTPAADVITINNVPSGFEGLQVNAGQGALSGVNVATTGTASTSAYIASVANTGGVNQAFDATVNGAGTNNTAIDLDVSGATNTNRGINIEVAGTGANGIRIDANNTLGSNGLTIEGAVNGATVTLVNATNGAAYTANLDPGDNQTGFRVDMNGGGATAAGVSISEIGSGTGAVIDMTGAAGAAGMNVLAVGTNTGISVQGVTGGGVGISSQYQDNGAGSAIQASTTSTNTSSEAIRATGVAAGGAAIDVTAGGVDATAPAGARFADSQSAAAVVGTTNPLVIPNTVVRAGSTIVVSYKNTSGGAFTVGEVYVTAQSDGSFTVQKTFMWNAGDVVEYIIINHGS